MRQVQLCLMKKEIDAAPVVTRMTALTCSALLPGQIEKPSQPYSSHIASVNLAWMTHQIHQGLYLSRKQRKNIGNGLRQHCTLMEVYKCNCWFDGAAEETLETSLCQRRGRTCIITAIQLQHISNLSFKFLRSYSQQNCLICVQITPRSSCVKANWTKQLNAAPPENMVSVPFQVCSSALISVVKAKQTKIESGQKTAHHG